MHILSQYETDGAYIFSNMAIMCGFVILNLMCGSFPLLPSYHAHSHCALLLLSKFL